MGAFNVDPRRQRPRVYFENKEIQIETDSGHKGTALFMDLSERGVGIVSSSGYFEGDKVDMRFDVLDQHMHIAGEVRRVTGKEIFIRFTSLTRDETEFITYFVEQNGTMKRPPRGVR